MYLSIAKIRRKINGKFLLSIFFGFFLVIIFVLWNLRTLNFSGFKEETVIIANNNSSKLAVVVVIEKESQLEDYRLAQNTLECYCKIYGYQLIKIIMEKSPVMKQLCPQEHIYFQRICVPMRILQQNPDIEYVFFLDADIGVINPKRRLEEYIDPKYDLTFYERIMFYDIMSGSFIAKNTQYSIDFLQEWLNLNDKFIKVLTKETLHNDQAAIHQVFLNRFYPKHPIRETCHKLWTTGILRDTHSLYVACARSIMNDTMEYEKIIIHPRVSHKTMVRDIWLTKSEWAPRDFMFHDFEQYRITNDQEKLQQDPWSYFPNPFLSDATFHSKFCIEEGVKTWKYNETFIKTDEYIDEKLFAKANQTRTQYFDTLETMKKIM